MATKPENVNPFAKYVEQSGEAPQENPFARFVAPALDVEKLKAETKKYEAEVPFTQRIIDPLKQGIAGLSGMYPGVEVSSIQKEINAIREGKRGPRDPLTGEQLPFQPEEQENAIKVLQEQQKEAQAKLMSSEAEAAKYQTRPAVAALSNVDTAKEAFKAFQVDPLGVMSSISLQSLPQIVPALILGAVTRNPTVGALAMGSTSFAGELSSGVSEYFQEQGINIKDPVEVNKALNDPAMFTKAYEYALTRGSIIGAADTAAAGLASKLLVPKNVIKNQFAKEAANIGVAQPVAQMLSGAGGEIAAQLATEGEVTKPGRPILEAVGEGPSSVLETAAFGGKEALNRLKTAPTEAAPEVSPEATPTVTPAAAVPSAIITEEDIDEGLTPVSPPTPPTPTPPPAAPAAVAVEEQAASPAAPTAEIAQRIDELDAELKAIDVAYDTATPDQFTELNARQGQIKSEIARLFQAGTTGAPVEAAVPVTPAAPVEVPEAAAPVVAEIPAIEEPKELVGAEKKLDDLIKNKDSIVKQMADSYKISPEYAAKAYDAELEYTRAASRAYEDHPNKISEKDFQAAIKKHDTFFNKLKGVSSRAKEKEVVAPVEAKKTQAEINRERQEEKKAVAATEAKIKARKSLTPEEIANAAQIIKSGNGIEYTDRAKPLLKKLADAGLLTVKGKNKVFISKEAEEAGIVSGSTFSPFFDSDDMRKLNAFLQSEKAAEVAPKIEDIVSPEVAASMKDLEFQNRLIKANKEKTITENQFSKLFKLYQDGKTPQADEQLTQMLAKNEKKAKAEEEPEEVTGTELKESESKSIPAQEIFQTGNKISNIRYAQDGKIAFTFNGQDFLIKEPSDVILVGTDQNLARKWIAKRYGFLLEPFTTTKETHIEGNKSEPVTTKTIEEAIDKAESNVDSKKIKTAIKNQFEQAIKRAKIQTEKEWESAKGLLPAEKFVTISVPGDGQFKVKNNVERLKELQTKMVNATTLKGPTVQGGPTSGSVEAFKGMVDDKDMENAIEYAKLKGLDPKTVKLNPAQRTTVDNYLKNPAEFERQQEESTQRAEARQTALRADQEKRTKERLEADEKREEEARFKAVLDTTIRLTQPQLKGDIAKRKITSADAARMLEVIPGLPTGTVKPYVTKELQKIAAPKAGVVTDDEGEKIDFPLIVDMAAKGYKVLGFDNPRTYADKAGNTFRTIEKDGVRLAIDARKVLFKQQGKEYGRVQYGIGRDKDVTFEHLQVDPSKRKQGLAKQAIQDLIDVADKNGYTLYLEPAQLEKQGMTKEQLSALYSKYGFVATNESGTPMEREPGAKAVPVETKAEETIEQYTKEEREDSEQHAKDLGGEIAYQKGDLALIRGYSILTGNPKYAVAKGKFRTNVGVESYTGNLITKEEKAELIDAVDKLEKSAKAKHDSNPFIKFENGIAISKDVSPEIAGVTKEWKRLLGLKPNIYITTVEDARANKNNFTGPHRAIGSATLSKEEAGTMRKMSDSSYYITFEKSTSKTKMLEVIAHELGHVHEREVFVSQPDEMKVKIRDEFDKWLLSQKGKSARELVNSMRAKTAAKTTVVPSGMKADDLSLYWKSFGEWYADQVSRWATTTDKPLTAVEKFFKRLGNQMRRFYGLLKNAGYLPTETFKQYLDDVSESQAMPPLRGEDSDFAPEAMVKKIEPLPKDELVESLLEKHNRPDAPRKPSLSVRDAFMGGYDNTKETVKDVLTSPLIATNNMIGQADRALTKFRNKNIFFGYGLEEADRQRYGGQVRNAHQQAIASVAVVNALHSGNIATQVMTLGKLEFNPNIQMFVAAKSDKSMANVVREKAKLIDKLGFDTGNRVIQSYFEAKRSRSIVNEYLNREAAYVTAIEEGQNEEEARKDLANIEAAVQKVNMNDEAMDDFIDLENKYPELRNMMDNWTAVNQNMIDMMEFSGIISKQRAKSLRSIKDYVPWYRIMDDQEDIHSAPKNTRGLTNVAADKKFGPGKTERDIDDIVDNMIHNVLTITRNSARNYAANRIVMEYGERYKDGKKAGKLRVFPKDGSDAEGVRFNIIANGRRIVVRIQDPLVAEAVIGMENIDIPMNGALAFMANTLRRSITTFPAFQVAQLFMDAPTASLVTGLKRPDKVWAGVFTSFLKNLRKDDPIVAKLRAAGIGGYQSSARTPEKEIQLDIGLIQGSWFSKAMKGLDRFGDASDYAQRRSVYIQTMKETGDEMLALFQANNVIDFKKRGSGQLAQLVTRQVAFMNAYAQSIDVLAKGLSGTGLKGIERKKALARMATAGMMLASATLVYCFLVGDDDEYNKLDDQTKMRTIFIPGLDIRLPMHSGAAFFFKAVPELLYNAITKEGTKDEYDRKRLARALGKAAADSLIGPNVTPTGVKPVVEIALNRNFFTGGQVTPRGMEDLAAYRQYNQNTSELGKIISALTGTEKTRLLNPIEADHLVRGLTGTIGAAVMWGTNLLSGDRVAPQAKDNPFYGQFIMPDVPRGREDLYYDLKGKTDEAYKTHQDLLKKGRKEEAADWFKENKQLIQVYGYTSAIEADLKRINGEIRRMSDLPGAKMSPDEKRKRMTELQEVKGRILKDVISMRKRAGLDESYF
jgi:GNAT superfamily N-acetyltransferase